METNKVLYRYKEEVKQGILFNYPLVDVFLDEYKVIKETEKSYLINIYNSNIFDFGNKWVLKTTNKNSRKRFAYDTKEAALVNYITRRRKQVELLTRQLRAAEEGLKQAEEIREKESFPEVKKYVRSRIRYHEF